MQDAVLSQEDSISIEFYNGTVRYLCHSTHFLLVFVCKLQ